MAWAVWTWVWVTWVCTAWDVGGMGDVDVQVCCVGVIGIGAGMDRKDMGVGGSGGVGMGVGGVGGVGVQGLDIVIGGSGVSVVGVAVGMGGMGVDAGLSRRLSPCGPQHGRPPLPRVSHLSTLSGCLGWPRRTIMRSWASWSSGLRALRRVRSWRRSRCCTRGGRT